MRRVAEMVIKHEVKKKNQKAYCNLETHNRVPFFSMLYERGNALTGSKYFWLTSSLFWLLLAIQNVTHVVLCFPVRSTKECCMENIALLFHANALTSVKNIAVLLNIK